VTTHLKPATQPHTHKPHKMAVKEPEIITCPAPAVDHLESFGFLFGYPIAHSLSPLLHQTIYRNLGLNWDYFPLPSTDVKSFLELVRDPRCYGENDPQNLRYHEQ
jgi:quinate dehydrogenase